VGDDVPQFASVYCAPGLECLPERWSHDDLFVADAREEADDSLPVLEPVFLA
jgi:hypothetical protein